MLNAFYLFFLFFAPAPELTLKVKIIDKVTSLPISYVHVNIENSTFGTITNEEGSFTLSIPENITTQNLVISHVGYEQKVISIQKMKEANSIELTPATILLQEVVVSGLDPFQILADAALKKKTNYPATPTRLIGFYRHGIKVNDHYTQFLEASMDIIFPHYGLIMDKSKVDREIYVNELRVFESENIYDVSPYRLFADLFFIPVTEKNYDAEIVVDKTSESELFIRAYPKNKQSGLPAFLFTIDRKTLAYKEVQYSIPSEFWETREFVERKIQTEAGEKLIKEKRVLAEITYSFSQNESQWYLKQVNQKSKFLLDRGDNKNDQVIYYINYVTNEVHDTISGLSRKNYLEKNQDIYKLKRKQNEMFWKNYPILQPSAEQHEIIAVIEETDTGN